jgi:CarD family transcriptional regulator
MKKIKNKRKKKLKKLEKITKLAKINKVEKQTNKKFVKQSHFKSNEDKVEIKKIKKQATEKRIYNIKDYVVYPKHGVGKIISINKAKIGEIDIHFYNVLIEKEKLTLSIPLNQQSHLRPVSSINQINKAVTILKSKPRIKRTMWSRRAQEYEQKINSGKLYELAEVVRDLNKKTDTIAEQSYSERQLFEKAYERLKSELEVVLSDKAQKKMDKALRREENLENLENQESKVITAT